jgi:hypothetical protein
VVDPEKTKPTNTGTWAWELFHDGEPTVDVNTTWASALPTGAVGTDLGPAVGENSVAWTWNGPGILYHDFYFDMRLIWSYGARYHGGGAWIPSCKVDIPAHRVDGIPYLEHWDIKIATSVGPPYLGGTDTAPIAELPLDVSIVFKGNHNGGKTAHLIVRGNGTWWSADV